MKTETNIYKKLLAFQKLNISVKKDGKNPHFKSAYATLNEVLDKVKKPLNDLGVLIIFTPESDGLTTCLYDTESDTKICGKMIYVGADNAQKLLACNTYFRRGSLVSLLGLEDEDNDGNDAVQAPVRKVEQKVEQGKEFVEAPIEKIKACSTVAELTTLYNFMPPQQQASEHILEAFKNKSKQLKTK
jgi:hypothetical protein